MLHIWTGAYIPVDDEQELLEIEDTKEFVKHRFAKLLTRKKIPFMLHVIVGSTESDSVAKSIAKKADEIPAALIVMAKHSKGFKELWLGSVTKSVFKYTTLPIAVVPHNKAIVESISG